MDVKQYHGQSYDSASNMFGKYKRRSTEDKGCVELHWILPMFFTFTKSGRILRYRG